MANCLPALWFLSASVMLLRKHKSTASMPPGGVEPARLEGRPLT
jgi:hypothetical protein